MITIIPLRLLKKARDRGAELDKMVTMMDDGTDAQVYDASGNLVSFLMVIATPSRWTVAALPRFRCTFESRITT